MSDDKLVLAGVGLAGLYLLSKRSGPTQITAPAPVATAPAQPAAAPSTAQDVSTIASDVSSAFTAAKGIVDDVQSWFGGN